MNDADTKVFRWLNYGTCLFRISFNRSDFELGGFMGLPVKVNTVWRREISCVISDWDHYSDYAKTLPPSAFSEEWLSSRAAFEQSDLIAVDVILDIFRDQSLRFCRPGENGGTAYDHVLCNFPEEPPTDLPAEIGLFDTSPEESLAAWEKFGETIATPTVFVTMENRDEIAGGYSDAFRAKLLDFQAKLTELAKKFPHWLVVSLDDILFEVGTELYVDRHHPTPEGFDYFRERFPQIIAQSGILKGDIGGVPVPTKKWNAPERGDTVAIDYDYVARLDDLPGEKIVLGPERLTAPVTDKFSGSIHALKSFGAMGKLPAPTAIVVMKWTQAPTPPPWVTGVMKKYPGTLVELPCLWPGRDNLIIGLEQTQLRRDLRVFVRAHTNAPVDLAELDSNTRLYVARLFLRSHTLAEGASQLMPRRAAADVAAVTLPADLAARVMETDLIPIFGPTS